MAAPTAEFSGSPTSGDCKLTVNFTDESTNTPIYWLWSFGDGETSNDQDPTHEYDWPGWYTVSLFVSNLDGFDTETKVSYIYVEPGIYAGRELKYDVRNVLDNGGELYWYLSIKKNPNDSWGSGKNQYVFGNIPGSSFTDANVKSSLISIGSIDQRGNIFNSMLAKIGDVDVRLEILSGDINDKLDEFVGHKCEIRCGHGTTMSEATSDVIFTGKIVGIRLGRDEAILTIRSLGELRNKVIGTILDDTAEERFRGKMIPIAHGDWTDNEAYLPCVIDSQIEDNPDFQFDSRTWKDLTTIRVWDDEAKQGYVARSDVTKHFIFTVSGITNEPGPGDIYSNNSSEFTILSKSIASGAGTLVCARTSGTNDPLASGTLTKVSGEGDATISFSEWKISLGYRVIGDENKIMLGYDTGATISEDVDATEYEIDVNDITKLKAQENDEVSSEKAESLILRIDNELMLCWKLTAGSPDVISVDRNYKNKVSGTDLTHSNGAAILKMNHESVRRLADCEHIFYPLEIGFPLSKEAGVSYSLFDKDTTVGLYISLLDRDTATYLRLINTKTTFTAPPANKVNRMDLHFQKIGISGPILIMYANLKASVYVRIDEVNATYPVDTVLSVLQVIKNKRVDSSDDLIPILTTSKTPPTGFDSDSINNIDGSDNVYKINFGGMQKAGLGGYYNDITLADINELANSCYSILCKIDPSAHKTTVRTAIYVFALRINFAVDLYEHLPYAKAEARKNPGGYFNGTSGTLIQNPSVILEDIMRNDIPDVSSTDLSEPFFDEAYTERNTDSWKLASVFYDEPKKMRDVIGEICKDGRILYFERYDGDIAIAHDEYAGGSVLRTLTESDIAVDNENRAVWKAGYSSLDDVYTRVEVHYKPILPQEKDKAFSAIKYCQRTNATGTTSNFDTEEATYKARLETAFDKINEDRTLIYYAWHIRDEASAELLCKSLINWHHKPLRLLELEVPYVGIAIEMWNRIKINVNVIPTEFDGNGTVGFLVYGNNIVPNVNDRDPKVNLKLIEIDNSV